ncbi:MAG: hypothetical protein V4479_09905 [Actinomycetota bacterium]
MAADPDEEALSWGTERDTTHIESPEVAAPVAATAEELKQTSSVLLVVYGIFAGAFVLYLVGWIVSIAHTTVPVIDVLPTIMYRLGEGLAIASPALWFLGVLVLTRGGHTRARILWLLLGLVLVAPWPFILGGVQ